MLGMGVHLFWLFQLITKMPSGGCKIRCYLSPQVRTAAVGQLGDGGLPSLSLPLHKQPKAAAVERAWAQASTECPSEPRALHRSLTCASPAKQGRLPVPGFADEHNIA